jgi:programmed cell death 6-interacting protein
LIKVASDRSGKDAGVKTYSSVFQQAYDKAKKENDYVYHEKVPDYKTLPIIERAPLAKATPIKFPLSEDFRGQLLQINN